jgi:hypothetical protein
MLAWDDGLGGTSDEIFRLPTCGYGGWGLSGGSLRGCDVPSHGEKDSKMGWLERKGEG